MARNVVAQSNFLKLVSIVTTLSIMLSKKEEQRIGSVSKANLIMRLSSSLKLTMLSSLSPTLPLSFVRRHLQKALLKKLKRLCSS